MRTQYNDEDSRGHPVPGLMRFVILTRRCRQRVFHDEVLQLIENRKKIAGPTPVSVLMN